MPCWKKNLFLPSRCVFTLACGISELIFASLSCLGKIMRTQNLHGQMGTPPDMIRHSDHLQSIDQVTCVSEHFWWRNFYFFLVRNLGNDNSIIKDIQERNEHHYAEAKTRVGFTRWDKSGLKERIFCFVECKPYFMAFGWAFPQWRICETYGQTISAGEPITQLNLDNCIQRLNIYCNHKQGLPFICSLRLIGGIGLQRINLHLITLEGLGEFWPEKERYRGIMVYGLIYYLFSYVVSRIYCYRKSWNIFARYVFFLKIIFYSKYRY